MYYYINTMNLVNLLEIECIYYVIINFLTNQQCYNLKLTNMRINKLMNYNGYLKDLNIKVNNFENMIKTHKLYNEHKRYLKYIIIDKIDDSMCMLPQFNNINIYINDSLNIKYNNSIKNITKLCITECEEIDMYELSHCKKLKQLSIYNNSDKTYWIEVSKMCEFNNLELLFISGELDLTKIIANKLKEIYISSILSLFINSYILCLYKKLEILYIGMLDKRTDLKLLHKNIKNVGILNNSILYLDNNIRKEYIDIFLNNCNMSYNNVVYNIKKKKITRDVSLFFIK
jgi:hypothetical protein